MEGFIVIYYWTFEHDVKGFVYFTPEGAIDTNVIGDSLTAFGETHYMSSDFYQKYGIEVNDRLEAIELGAAWKKHDQLEYEAFEKEIALVESLTTDDDF
jgi:hypothetical protein